MGKLWESWISWIGGRLTDLLMMANLITIWNWECEIEVSFLQSWFGFFGNLLSTLCLEKSLDDQEAC